MPARRRNPDAPARVRLVGFDKPRALRPAVEAFIRDVFDASHPLPFQNAYRTQRVLANIEAVVEVLPEHGGIKIETLRALSRRKGEGTKAMRFLTDLADKHGVSLYLYAKPFGDEAMDLDDLVRFYRRFGFRQAEEADEEEDEYEGVEMHRWPREVWPQEAQRTNPRRRNPSQTDTPAFKAWFGASEVVDAGGRPLRVYHGTGRAGFDTFGFGFRQDEEEDGYEGGRRLGFFFSDDPKVAGTYTGSDTDTFDLVTKKDRRIGQPAVYEVYLRTERPFVVDAGGAAWHNIPADRLGDYAPFVRKALGNRSRYFTTDDLAFAADRIGYDGLIVKNVADDEGGWGPGQSTSTLYVVFDPHQIKSANMNSGKYSLTDASILRNPRRSPTPLKAERRGTAR